MRIATEDLHIGNVAIEADSIRSERQYIVRRLIFRAMQDMCPCERIIMHYRLMCDDNDRMDPQAVAKMLGCTARYIITLQSELEGKLRVLLRHLVVS